ncbi:MAG: ABC transporter permease [Burkholderiaceae bacterium]|nr:ABC transporter permease [Burkholderiaceae bacterium]
MTERRSSPSPLPDLAFNAWLAGLGRGVWRWVCGWWQIVVFSAELLVLAFSPACWHQSGRRAVLLQMYLASAPGLPGFTVLMALFNVVVIRIVVVTALSYGLSQYSLDAVVRVLVLELVPLAAALFIAVEYTIPGGSWLYKLRRDGGFARLRAQGIEPLAQEALPRVLAGMFAVLLLAAISCTLSLVLAYIAVHGFVWSAVGRYSHAVGNIFNPVVTMIFGLKTFMFAATVALLPVANALRNVPRRAASRTSVELQGLVQMFVLLLLIEILSLIGNYY